MPQQVDPAFDDPTRPPIFGIPFNRIVAFAGPHISWLSGVFASWLLIHVHFLGLFHFQHDGLSTGIAQGITFVLVTVVSWLGQRAWIKGHHIELANGGLAVAADEEEDDWDELDDEDIEDELDADYADIPEDTEIPPDEGDVGNEVA